MVLNCSGHRSECHCSLLGLPALLQVTIMGGCLGVGNTGPGEELKAASLAARVQVLVWAGIGLSRRQVAVDGPTC